MWTEILIAGISTTGALGGTWLGSYLNRKTAIDTARQLVAVEGQKHAQSRLWDAKKDAYTGIIALFNAIDKTLDGMSMRLFDPDIDPQGYIDSKDHSQDNLVLWNRIRALDAMLDDNSLIASDEFKAAFEQWRIEFIDYGEDHDPREIAHIQSDATKRHRPVIIKMAKDELEVIPKG